MTDALQNLHILSQTLAQSHSNNDLLSAILHYVQMGELLSNAGFHRGALHAYQQANKCALLTNHAQHTMNATAASLLQLIYLGESIETHALYQACTHTSIDTCQGGHALCVVGSKCYLASRFRLAFDFFALALKIDATSKIAWTYSGDILCMTGAGKIQPELTQRARWEKAQTFYLAALRIDSNFVDAKSSLAELHRQRGDLKAALLEYTSIYVCLGVDSSCLDHIFNHAQCLESLSRMGDCFCLLAPHAELALQKLPPCGDATRLGEHAIVLYYMKIRFVLGQLDVENRVQQNVNVLEGHSSQSKLSLPTTLTPWSALIECINGWSKEVEMTIRLKLATHWAYGHFLRQLWNLQPREVSTTPATFDVLSKQRTAWIPIVGDSHCLSLAWSKVKGRTVVPFIATGLKAWHMRPGCQFVTTSNLNCIFEHLDSVQVHTKTNNNNKKESQQPLVDCLFSVGEIDCRNNEGIMRSVAQGVYPTLEAAVGSLVEILVHALQLKSKQYGLYFHLLSIPPPSDRSHAQRARVVGILNQQLRAMLGVEKNREWITFIDIESVCSSSDKFLKEELYADGTHVNQKIGHLVDACMGLHPHHMP